MPILINLISLIPSAHQALSYSGISFLSTLYNMEGTCVCLLQEDPDILFLLLPLLLLPSAKLTGCMTDAWACSHAISDAWITTLAGTISYRRAMRKNRLLFPGS